MTAEREERRKERNEKEKRNLFVVVVFAGDGYLTSARHGEVRYLVGQWTFILSHSRPMTVTCSRAFADGTCLKNATAREPRVQGEENSNIQQNTCTKLAQTKLQHLSSSRLRVQAQAQVTMVTPRAACFCHWQRWKILTVSTAALIIKLVDQ
jgi:hypothetical protein